MQLLADECCEAILETLRPDADTELAIVDPHDRENLPNGGHGEHLVGGHHVSNSIDPLSDGHSDAARYVDHGGACDRLEDADPEARRVEDTVADPPNREGGPFENMATAADQEPEPPLMLQG